MTGDDEYGEARQQPQFGYGPGGRGREPYLDEAVAPPPVRARRGRSLLPTLLAGSAIILFSGFVLIAYHRSPTLTGGGLPVIAAETTPVKVKPDAPGGDVPFQETTVYDDLARGKGRKPPTEVEHLLQPPEQPLPKPEVPRTETAQTGGAATAEADPGDAGEPEPRGANEPTPDQPGDDTAVLAPAGEGSPSEAGPRTPPALPVPAGAGKLPLPPAAASTADGADADTEPAAQITLAQTKSAPSTLAPTTSASAKAARLAAAAPATPAAKAGPSPAHPATGGGGLIQLGAFRDAAGANAEWKRLQGRYPAQLGPLTSSVQRADLGAKGIWFRLKAGPLDPDRARDVCGTLKAANAPCIAP